MEEKNLGGGNILLSGRDKNEWRLSRKEKSLAGLGGGEKQIEERKEREKQREEIKRKRGRGRKKIGCLSPDLRCSDGRNSSNQEVKSVNSKRATLQEVGIIPTCFISTLRVVWLYFGTVRNATLF